MNKQEIEAKVKEALVEQSGVDESKVTNTANLVTDLELDSLDILETTMNLEKEFNVTIEDEESAKLNEKPTVQNMVDLFAGKVK